MNHITLEEILILHEYQIEKFGGKPGISDVRMLESAVLRPQTTFDGDDLYTNIYEKAAALVYSLIKNHPFIDGNKRTGLHAMLTFLELNNAKVGIDNETLTKLGSDIADNRIDEQGIVKIIERYSQQK